MGTTCAIVRSHPNFWNESKTDNPSRSAHGARRTLQKLYRHYNNIAVLGCILSGAPFSAIPEQNRAQPEVRYRPLSGVQSIA